MSTLPLKTVKDLYERAKAKRNWWHKGGREYEAYMYADGRFLLSHFGTTIFDYDPDAGTYAVAGESVADRDAINSMFRILGIDDAASNMKGKITLSDGRVQGTVRRKANRNAKPKYSPTDRPKPNAYGSAPYSDHTSAGHTIAQVYYDPYESEMMGRPVYDVVAKRKDISGLIWGRDYDPVSGMWLGGDYDQTPAMIEKHSNHHKLIASYSQKQSGSGNGKAGRKPSRMSNANARSTPVKGVEERTLKGAEARKVVESAFNMDTWDNDGQDDRRWYAVQNGITSEGWPFTVRYAFPIDMEPENDADILAHIQKVTVFMSAGKQKTGREQPRDSKGRFKSNNTRPSKQSGKSNARRPAKRAGPRKGKGAGR